MFFEKLFKKKENYPEKAKYKKIMRFANGEVTTVEDNA